MITWDSRKQGQDRSVSLDEPIYVCLLYVVWSLCWTCHNQHGCLIQSSPQTASPFEQSGMKTDQVLLHQERGAERCNEFQEAEHANEFIIPAWFRSNYHFASKAIQDWVALVKLNRLWIQINISMSANAQGGPLWQPEIGVAIFLFPHSSAVVVCWYPHISRSWGLWWGR